MSEINQDLAARRRELIEELRNMGEFRRGSLNEAFRLCGKSGCACQSEGHPGHGPQVTLTFKKEGKTKTYVLSSLAAVRVVEGQLENRNRYLEWSKRWRELNESISDQKLNEALSEHESERNAREKKRRR